MLGEGGFAIGGLPGVFGDSLPDGWGRLLIDRELERRGSGRTAIGHIPPAEAERLLR